MTGKEETPDRAPSGLGYGSIAAVSVTVIIYLLAQLLALGVLIGALMLLGKDVATIQDSSPVMQFFAIVLMEGFTLGLLGCFLWYRRTHVTRIGLVLPQLRDAGYALAGYAVYFILLIAVTQLASKLIPGLDLQQEQDVGFDKSTTGGALALIFISLVVLPPLAEEIMTRGFLYTGLRTKLPKLLAALFTSGLFAAAHLQGGKGGQLIWVAALDTFTLSMILVYLREKTGSLWPCIGVHMLKNGAAFALIFIFKVA